MLNQVFTNILINACQAIEGEGTIDITTFAQDDKIKMKNQRQRNRNSRRQD